MLSKIAKVTMFAVGLLGVAGVVAAQETSGEAAPAAPPSTPPSAELMRTRAKSIVSSLDQASQNVGRMLRDARAAKDVVKALCLDDMLSQVDVAKRTAADRTASLESALADGNTDQAAQDFEVLGAIEERANALSAEAQQCIGEEKGYAGGSSLKVTTDPTIPQNDTSAPPSSAVVTPATTPAVVPIPDAASPTS